MESLEAKIEESLLEYFENFFPCYDMTKYTAELLKWLKDDGLEICQINPDE